LQRVEQADHVAALAGDDLLADFGKDGAVLVAVEVRRLQVANAVQRVVVEQQRADDRLLGMDGFELDFGASIMFMMLSWW
jgi:hypothetical protein